MPEVQRSTALPVLADPLAARLSFAWAASDMPRFAIRTEGKIGSNY